MKVFCTASENRDNVKDENCQTDLFAVKIWPYRSFTFESILLFGQTRVQTLTHTHIWWTASSLIASHKSPNGSNGNTVTNKKKVKRASENERNKTRTYPFTKWQKAKEKKGRERERWETTETKNETRSHAFHLISVVGISRNRMDSSTEWSAIVQTNARRQQQQQQQQDRMRAHLFSPNI